VNWVPITAERRARFSPDKQGLLPTMMSEYGSFSIKNNANFKIPIVEGDSPLNNLVFSFSTGQTNDAEFGATIKHSELDEEGNPIYLYDMAVDAGFVLVNGNYVAAKGITFQGDEGDGLLTAILWHHN
jgi:hypothetical protein